MRGRWALGEVAGVTGVRTWKKGGETRGTGPRNIGNIIIFFSRLSHPVLTGQVEPLTCGVFLLERDHRIGFSGISLSFVRWRRRAEYVERGTKKEKAGKPASNSMKKIWGAVLRFEKGGM